MYTYKPKRFYLQVFIATWAFWLFAILFDEGLTCTLGMFLGLISPASIAIITVFTSKSQALKKDFKRKNSAGGEALCSHLFPGQRDRFISEVY